jgi:isoleucyl-tRNA synthetase
MSKSLGNVIAPHEVIKKYGAEVLRLWVSAEDYREDVRISEEILKRLSEAYRRIRNTFRYILGNLYDFDPARDSVPYNELAEIDRLTLARLARLSERVVSAYKGFEFHVIYHSVHNFCSVDLSAFYLDAIKDRLYTGRPDSRERRAAQTTIYNALSHLLRLTSPILVFTAEEAWSLMPGVKEESVHLSAMPETRKEWTNDPLERKWEGLLAIKAEISKALEGARQTARIIGHSLDAEVTVYPKNSGLERLLLEEKDNLKEVLIISGLVVMEAGAPVDATGETHTCPSKDMDILVKKASGEKCQRCWHYSPSVGKDPAHTGICERCSSALR